MSGLGEWDDDPADTSTGTARQVSEVLGSIDVAAIAGDLVAATVEAEIRRQVQRIVKPIVTEAVAAVLTPERLAALREAATAAATAELTPADGSATAEEDDEDDPPKLYYKNVAEFVEKYVVPTFRRNVGERGRADYRWSARWWESPEARVRLEALWRAWEHLRRDSATGMSVWLRDHADHHLAILMKPTGPWMTSKDTSGPNEWLPYEPPPANVLADLFPDARDG